MSYSLVFAREGVPEGDDAAWVWIDSQMDAYHADQRGPHPVFRRFHDSLTARYPCICSLSDDEVDDGVWSDGPLIDNFAQDVAKVGLSSSMADEVLPFILRTAAEQGIVTFDYQTGDVHRPHQLDTSGPLPVAKWTKTEVRRLIVDAVAPAVSDAGFRCRKGSGDFVRKIEGGWQKLIMPMLDRKPLFEFSFTLCIRLEAVQEAVNRFSGVLPKYRAQATTSITQLEFLRVPRPGVPRWVQWLAQSRQGVNYPLESEAGLMAMLPGVVSMIRENVVPFFEEYCDVVAVNRAMNPKGSAWLMRFRVMSGRHEFDSTVYPYRVLTGVAVAHFARDPRREALIAAYRSQIRRNPESDRKALEGLVNYLNESSLRPGARE